MRLKFSNNAKYFYLSEKREKMPGYFLKSVAYNLLSNLITAQNLDLELGGWGELASRFGFGNFGDFVRTCEKSLACYALA